MRLDVTRFAALGLLMACATAVASPEEMSHGQFGQWAKQELTATFKDPESAKFKDTHVFSVRDMPKRRYLCGQVNAKNGYGAYVGYRRFWVGVDGDLRFEGNEPGEYEPGLFAVLRSEKCYKRLLTVSR